MDNIYFGDNLRYLREKKGLTQSEIEASTTFSRTTWSNYETEKSFPNFKGLLELSNYLDISLDDLVYKKLSEGGDLPKRRKHELYVKGGDSGGDLGGDYQKLTAKAGALGQKKAGKLDVVIDTNVLIMMIEEKDRTNAALEQTILSLQDHNKTLNSIIQVMSQEDTSKGKRSAAG